MKEKYIAGLGIKKYIRSLCSSCWKFITTYIYIYKYIFLLFPVLWLIKSAVQHQAGKVLSSLMEYSVGRVAISILYSHHCGVIYKYIKIVGSQQYSYTYI